MKSLTSWLRSRWRAETTAERMQPGPSQDVKPSVPTAYMPLYVYLDRRYAATVVLTLEQIEALLGFALPATAFSDVAWWTNPRGTNEHDTAAWTAARRTATPQLSARTVVFERLP